MYNFIFGIPVIILSLILFVLAWKYQEKENYRIAVLLLIAGGLILRLFVSADMFLHPWDERYHALVAKHMIEHPFLPTLYENPLLPYDFKSWITNHVWLHKQPLALWSMAASMSIFGVNEIALRLPSIIFSTLCIPLTFSIGKYLFDKRTAFVGALLIAINGLVIELVAGRVPTDHIDIAFLFFIELAIFLSIQFVKTMNSWLNILAGICIGAAILTKWLPALIVLPVWLLLVIDSAKFKYLSALLHFIILLAITVLVFLPWQIYIFNIFPAEASWESHYNFIHLTEVVEERGGAFYFFVDKMRINYGELIYLPFIWFLWKSFRQWGDLKSMAVTVWILIPLAFFSAVATKMQAYTLFISPALFLITASFFFWLVEYRKKNKFKWLTGLVLLLLIALPARYSIERIKPFDNTERNPVWVKELKALDEEGIENGVLFNYDKPIEAMFYTRLTVYPEIPSVQSIQKLVSEGYLILINDKANISDEIRHLEQIKLVVLNEE